MGNVKGLPQAPYKAEDDSRTQGNAAGDSLPQVSID